MHYSLNERFDTALRICLIEVQNHLIRLDARVDRLYAQLSMLDVFATSDHDYALVTRLHDIAHALDRITGEMRVRGEL